MGKAGSEEAKIIREMIRHEDALITARVTWFCTVQGFLFAALAFAWEKSTARPLVYILASVGLLVALSLFVAVRAALQAIKRQRQWWDENHAETYVGPDVIGLRPRSNLAPFLHPSIVLPFTFGLAWLGVIIVDAMRSRLACA